MSDAARTGSAAALAPRTGWAGARHGPIRASLVSLTCLVRRVPLFFASAPKTPLRVLCIVALDTLHVLRTAQHLPATRIEHLAAFLDFQACANASWDRKAFCPAEYRVLRHRLETAGLGLHVEAYLAQVGEVETCRPATDRGRQRFEEVRAYREAVAWRSLAAVTAIALRADRPDDGPAALQRDSDVDMLFRIVMQCQIIDDVVDYAEDASAGLPSFLTASGSLPEVLRSTAAAARDYAAGPGLPSGDRLFPLRVALHVVTALTHFVVRSAHLRLGILRHIAR